jgi:hypothetical protein
MIYRYTTFHLPSPNGPLVIATRPRTKYRYRESIVVVLHYTQIYDHTKFRILHYFHFYIRNYHVHYVTITDNKVRRWGNVQWHEVHIKFKENVYIRSTVFGRQTHGLDKPMSPCFQRKYANRYHKRVTELFNVWTKFPRLWIYYTAVRNTVPCCVLTGKSQQ